MARTIWVVMGATGEYSDHSTWLVCAYEDEAAAKKHADDATAAAFAFHKARCPHDEEMTHYCDECGRQYGDIDRIMREAMGDLDPTIRMDYTGTDYVALPVEMRSAP